MNFIDHTGHIYEQKEYNHKPIGYEYETNPYIFWIDGEYSNRLSVGNYYVRPIRIVMPASANISEIEISVDSNVFSLIGSTLCENQTNYQVEIFESELCKTIKYSESQIAIYDGLTYNEEEYSLIPFYIISNSDEEGAWTSNVLIKIVAETGTIWCPITVGATYYDEFEELIINGHNMGVNLPKDIIKAVYRGSYWNDTVDEVLYGEKIKEYLMNFMSIKGEIGNYESALNSLKWFEWGDKLEITKLLQTDNVCLRQFLHDDFDINTDLMESFKDFRNSTYISLHLRQNKETYKEYPIDFGSDFWGEGKPIYEDLFDKQIFRNYDDGHDINYYRPYYDFVFEEMYLKLACLRYFYQKYFLPVHLKLHSTSIWHTVHANDIKLVQKSHVKYSERPILIGGFGNKTVTFLDNSDTYYIYNHQFFVDDNFNRFSVYNEEYGRKYDVQLYYIDDVCIEIPIKFSNADIYNCVLKLSKGTETIYVSNFSFTQNEASGDYLSLAIVPKVINKDWDINRWIDEVFTIQILCNGRWYQHSFRVKAPQLQLTLGKLEYKYDNELQRQIEKIENGTPKFNSYMYVPKIANINDINFHKILYHIGTDYATDKVVEQIERLIEMYQEKIIVPDNLKYYNRVSVYDLFGPDGNSIPYAEGDYSLYSIFFNEDGSQAFEQLWDEYATDFYLMHDNEIWYGVFISKDTVNNFIDKQYEPSEKNIVEEYNIKLRRAENMFLINRMHIVDSENEHHFTEDDIIIASIDNVEMPFIMHRNAKWNFDMISFNKDTVATTVTGRTNAAIMSIENSNKKYKKGYYNIRVLYSVDGTTTHSQELIEKILVK